MSFFQSSSIRGFNVLGFTARPPLGKFPYKRPSTGSSLPSWGWLFSDPSRILCAGGSFSATPIAFCASECQKHMGKCSVATFLHHLAPHVGHLARLVGHLGANMSHKCFQDARKMPSWSQHRQTNASATSSSTPKYQKNLFFRRFL